MRQTLLLTFVLFVGMAFGQNPLLIPSTVSGSNISLNLQNGTYEFFSGIQTQTMGVNGDILGPTVLLNQGDSVHFAVHNGIGQETTMHWHGMHVSAINDGGPHTVINPGDTWTPSFKVLDKAGVYWYHPHLHMHTNEHVSKGIAGLIIVRDSEEAALDLPRTYGVDDFPLVIQTKDFDANHEIVVPSNSDDVIMVNATIDAELQVPAQVVRFRVLDGSSMRVFNLGLSNNAGFYQIGSDGGLLASPYQTNRVRIAPGERVELLIDFSGMEGQTVYLMSYASEFPNGIYGATNPGMMPMLTLNGYNPNPINGANFNLLKFVVQSPTANPVTSVPSTLAEVTPYLESDVNTTRTLTMSPQFPGPNHLNGKFYINGVSFDLDVINYNVPLNNTEIWEIRNQSGIAHPFHIHDVQFYILTRNGAAPPPNEQGRKDVVLVRPMETVRFITKFEDFADDEVPYMYHCHMLIHEDDGMMGQFVVSSALPVDYSRPLYAKVVKEGIRLSWETKEEIGAEKFVIQRLEGDHSWKDLGEVSAGRGSYRFLDTAPLRGINYYRLKQVDSDGWVEYSHRVSARWHAFEALDLYPNPTSGVACLSDGKEHKVLIQDLTGRTIQLEDRVQCLTVNRSGLYIVRVLDEAAEPVLLRVE